MARGANKLVGRDATPTLEYFGGFKHNTIIIGASVLELTRTDGSKGMSIQNGHASQVLYIVGGIPQLIQGYRKDMIVDSQRSGQWFLSSNGINEWYYALTSPTVGNGADPGLTECTYLYYKERDGDETLGTAGTVGALGSEHNWAWGNGTEWGTALGFNTIYMKTDGTGPSNSPAKKYEYILSYTFTLTADDTATTGGFEIAVGASYDVTLDGAGKVFAIASGATTPAKIIEVF